LSTASRTVIDLGDIEIRFLVETQESEGAATVFECRVAADARVPAAHSHEGFEETVYGLEGVTTFTVDDDTRDIGPGDAMCIRRGQVHQFVNRGGAHAKFLSVATPGIFGPDYFHEIREVLTAGGPPDVVALMEVMRRHGLDPA
jgi:quercetin dioxygenase-like cupin family protein